MSTLSNLRIGTRLGLGFGILLLFIAAMAATGFVGAAKLFEESKTIYEDRTVPLADLGQIDYLLQRNRVLIMDTLVQSNPEIVQRRLAELRTNKDSMDALWQKFTATQLTPDESRLAETFSQARRMYETDGLVPAAEAMAVGDTDKAAEIYSSKISSLAPPTADAMRKLVQLQVDVAAQEFKDAEELETTIEFTMVSAAVIAMLLGIATAIGISRSITRPINEAVKVATTVAGGDLTSQINPSGTDETADLLRALKAMNDSLITVVGEVRGNAESVATASAQIAQGNADLSQRTEEQAAVRIRERCGIGIHKYFRRTPLLTPCQNRQNRLLSVLTVRREGERGVFFFPRVVECRQPVQPLTHGAPLRSVCRSWSAGRRPALWRWPPLQATHAPPAGRVHRPPSRGRPDPPIGCGTRRAP